MEPPSKHSISKSKVCTIYETSEYFTDLVIFCWAVLSPQFGVLAIHTFFPLVILVDKPVGRAPSFTSELSPIKAIEGDDCKIECIVSAKPEPSVQWFKDGQVLKSDYRIKPRFDGQTITLQLKDVSLSDRGSYKCVVTNDLGSVSSSADMVVEKRKYEPEIISRPKDVKGLENTEARFDIKLKGYPTPSVEWYHDSEKIEHGNKYKITESKENQLYSLEIKDLQKPDSGIYKCVASNEVGKIDCRAKLEVNEKQFAPEFEDKDTTKVIELEEGEELNERATIRGNPKPEVSWYKNGKPLRETSRIELKPIGNHYDIYIRRVLPDDSGTYKCVGTNDLGTTTKILDVKVKGT